MQYKKILSCCFDFTSMSPFQLWTVSLYWYLVLWAMIRIWGNILFPYSVIASTNSKSKQIWIYVDCLVTPIDWEWYIEAYIWVSLYTYYMILMSFPACCHAVMFSTVCLSRSMEELTIKVLLGGWNFHWCAGCVGESDGIMT